MTIGTLNYMLKDLKSTPHYFIQLGNMTLPEYIGWKYTVIGQSWDDLEWLVENLVPVLDSFNLSFKIGTKKLLDCKNKPEENESGEQHLKLITIYPKKIGSEAVAIAVLLQKALNGYTAHLGVDLKGSAHLWGPVYTVLDIKDGEYITAKGRKPSLDHLPEQVKKIFNAGD